jgi:hypothetical protein
MEVGKLPVLTRFGMMPAPVALSLAGDTHYRIPQREGQRGRASPVWVG